MPAGVLRTSSPPAVGLSVPASTADDEPHPILLARAPRSTLEPKHRYVRIQPSDASQEVRR